VLGGGNCIDLDNYDGDISAAVPALVAEGCRYAIVGCQDPAIALRQVAALRSGGVAIIGVYAYLYWGYDVLAETEKAVEVASHAGIPRVYLDCERDGELAGVTSMTRIAQLRQAVAAVRDAGLDPGIYTGEPFWREAMANTTEFAGLPLWHAAYWYDLHHVPTVSYGGWTDIAVHQYTASGNLYSDADGSLVTVPSLAGVSTGYNLAFPGGLAMSFTEAQEQRIREIATDTVALQFRALLDAAFTGGFTEPDGTPLPVPPGVAAYIRGTAPSPAALPDHVHSPGGVSR